LLWSAEIGHLSRLERHVCGRLHHVPGIAAATNCSTQIHPVAIFPPYDAPPEADRCFLSHQSGGAMRFFTDHYFSEAEKAEMLGGSYDAYVQEQLRKRQLEQERQSRLSELERRNQELQLEQQAFDRNSTRFVLAILACILLAVLASSFGMQPFLSYF